MRHILYCLTLILSLVVVPFCVAAQNGAPEASIVQTEISSWEKTARRAEDTVEAGRASTVAMEGLREELVVWREQFQQARKTNESRIETLNAQISALGAAPDDGSEAPEIAAQRSNLAGQLSVLLAPVKAAEVSYSRADTLIRSLDRIIRDRQTDALFKLGATPLNPALWVGAIRELGSSITGVKNEIITAKDNPIQRATAWGNLPEILFFLVIAFILLLRGRYWMELLTRKVQAKEHNARYWVLAFVLSILQILLPVIGIFSFAIALYATEMVGLRGDLIVSSTISLCISFFVSKWLGARIFPKVTYGATLLNLDEKQRGNGRLYSALLGFLLGVFGMINALAHFDHWEDGELSVVVFPVFLLAGYALIRLARLIMAHVSTEQVEGEERSFKNLTLYYLARIIYVLAIAGPALAAIGYFQAAQAIMFPMVISLALMAFLLILQRVVSEVYVLLTKGKQAAGDALIPVLISFALVLLSTPIFALIWGARETDITELWTQFKGGFSIGDSRISPSDFLTFALVFVIGYMLTRLIQGTLRSTVLPKTKMDVGGRNAVVSGVGYVGIFLAAMIAISTAGIDLSSLAIVAGALSVGIGFGLQNIVSNFVSGIILLIERPISEGDWIEVGGKSGIVRDISVRSTRIETFDKTDVIVPNSDFVSGTVTNYTRGNTIGRLKVSVGVAYGTDTKKVEQILREIGEAHPMVHKAYNLTVLFRGFGADSMDFEIRAILRDVDSIMTVHSDMNHEIARRFAEEGIEIPFAQRDVWLRNPEALKP